MSKKTNQVCNNYAGCGHSISIFDQSTFSHIKVNGFRGYWHIIDHKFYVGKDVTYYLCEHDLYGDETACIIIDKDYNLVLADVWNGFSDLEEEMEWEQYKADMFSIVKTHYLGTITQKDGYVQKTTLYRVKFESKNYDVVLLETELGGINSCAIFYNGDRPKNYRELEKQLMEYYKTNQ